MGSFRSTALNRLTKPILTPLVSAAVRPVTGYIRLPCRIFSNEVRKVATLPDLRGSDPFRLPEAYDG